MREFVAGIQDFAATTGGADADQVLKYKGDALEVFAEVFSRHMRWIQPSV